METRSFPSWEPSTFNGSSLSVCSEGISDFSSSSSSPSSSCRQAPTAFFLQPRGSGPHAAGCPLAQASWRSCRIQTDTHTPWLAEREKKSTFPTRYRRPTNAALVNFMNKHLACIYTRQGRQLPIADRAVHTTQPPWREDRVGTTRLPQPSPSPRLAG